MFVKIGALFALLFLVHCNKGKVELERCGCVDSSNRRQILVRVSMDREQIPEFYRAVIDFERGGGGRGDFDPLRIEGLCTEWDSDTIVFCAEDRRDYEVLEERFQEASFREEPIN